MEARRVDAVGSTVDVDETADAIGMLVTEDPGDGPPEVGPPGALSGAREPLGRGDEGEHEIARDAESVDGLLLPVPHLGAPY